MADDKVAIWGSGLKFGRKPANGELLIGNGQDMTMATLTAGAGASITNSAGAITISATGSGGTVTGVSASSPLASSGGASPNISLTGTVGVANGGTGRSSLTANNVILGNGTSAVGLVAPSASGNVLTSDGTTWASSAPQWARTWKKSNQSVTSNTALVSDNDLRFTVQSGKTYSFLFNVIHFSGGGGSFFAVDGPTSPSSIYFAVNTLIGASSYNTSAGSWLANYTISFQAMGVIAVGSTGGTVILRYAQSASSATSMTIYAGSWLEWAEVI